VLALRAGLLLLVLLVGLLLLLALRAGSLVV